MSLLEPIQMLWVGGRLSRLELLCVRSFLAHRHPVHLYHYDDVPNAPAGVELRDADAILPGALAPRKPVPPFAQGSMKSFSNVFRYHLLHRLGGWWADMDFVCLRPWRFDAPALTASTLEERWGRIANCCAMRFPAGHPVLSSCIEACDRPEARANGYIETGPLLLHRVLGELGSAHLMLAPSVFCPVPWNATWQLLRPLWRRFTPGELLQRIRRPHLSMCYRSDTVACHLWNELWRKAGRDKDARGPFSCLYERYQRRWNP